MMKAQVLYKFIKKCQNGSKSVLPPSSKTFGYTTFLVSYEISAKVEHTKDNVPVDN